jgi:lysozyme
MDQLSAIITLHEGLKLKPYFDTVGKMTIGVGRNLDDVGISHDEAFTLLSNDITNATIQLSQYLWFVKLDPVRQGVLIELVFNIGMSRFLQFNDMIAALKVLDYTKASNELLDSLWANQVGHDRASNMARRLLLGRYP